MEAAACRLASIGALAESCSSKATWRVTVDRSDGGNVQNCTRGGDGGGGLAWRHATKVIPAAKQRCCQARRSEGRILWGRLDRKNAYSRLTPRISCRAAARSLEYGAKLQVVPVLTQTDGCALSAACGC